MVEDFEYVEWTVLKIDVQPNLLLCSRCERTEEMTLPMTLLESSDKMKRFTDKHRDCKTEIKDKIEINVRKTVGKKKLQLKDGHVLQEESCLICFKPLQIRINTHAQTLRIDIDIPPEVSLVHDGCLQNLSEEK